MERHVERGIVLPRDIEHQIDGFGQLREIDAEMRQLIVKPEGEHALRALANRRRAQQ